MIAALFLASGLGLSGLAVKPDLGPTQGQQADAARLKQCVALIEEDPENAYEQAMAWGNEAHVSEARRCAALANVARGDPTLGAQQLEALAKAKDGGDMATRGEMLVEAGNAWILAEQNVRAIAAFDAALKLAPKAPDVLNDRARAFALSGRWREAEDDCSAVIDQRPKDVFALTLRAKARLEQNVIDLALKDAEAALAVEPKNDIALEVRGAAIEAKRLAKKPAG